MHTFRCSIIKMLVLMVTVSGIVGVLGGCSRNPVTGEQELSLISREQEIAMGREAAPQLEDEFGGKVPDDQLQSYVNQVGLAVAAKSDRDMPYDFTLVRSDVPNAFALPGGKIFITAGLMVRMENERQLAAVLAHEVSHVAAKHNVKGLQRQMGAAVLVEVAGAVISGDAGTAAKWGAKIATNMMNLKYSRNDEYQADAVGISYMKRAGYHPQGMVELLTVLYNLSETEPGSLTEMFQTHPLTSKRIEQAQELIVNDPPAPDPHASRFLTYRQRLWKYVGQ